MESQNISLSPKLLGSAATAGHLDICEWFNSIPDVTRVSALQHGRECVCSYAAEKGHLEVIKWARREGFPWWCAVEIAVKHGQWAVVEWALLNEGSK